VLGRVPIGLVKKKSNASFLMGQGAEKVINNLYSAWRKGEVSFDTKEKQTKLN